MEIKKQHKNVSSSFVPRKLGQKCPVCNGFGTLSWGKLKCQACMGKGYILIPAKEVVNARHKR